MSTLDWAVALAGAVDGRVCAAYASNPVANSYGHPYGQTLADQAEELVRTQVARAAAHGADLATIVDVDHPLPALRRAADTHDASVVVVGRKGAGHLRGVLLGRVPSELPFLAHRPVAIASRTAAR